MTDILEQMSRAALTLRLVAWTLVSCAARTASEAVPLETHLRAKAIADRFRPCSQKAHAGARQASGESVVVGRLVKDRPMCREVGALEECSVDCGWEYLFQPLEAEERYVLGGLGNLMNWANECEFDKGDVPGIFSIIGEIKTSTMSRVSVLSVREICRLSAD